MRLSISVRNRESRRGKGKYAKGVMKKKGGKKEASDKGRMTRKVEEKV